MYFGIVKKILIGDPHSQVVQKELCDSLHQHSSRRRIAHSMPAPGKRKNLHVLPSFYQVIDHRKRVRVVHVVVARSVRDQQLALELRSVLDRGRILITFLVGLRQT